MNSHIQRIGVLKVKSCYSTQQATPSRRPQWCWSVVDQTEASSNPLVRARTSRVELLLPRE